MMMMMTYASVITLYRVIICTLESLHSKSHPLIALDN